eukprot:46863-Eustigmatos_ZCMA.PRE.1
MDQPEASADTCRLMASRATHPRYMTAPTRGRGSPARAPTGSTRPARRSSRAPHLHVTTN